MVLSILNHKGGTGKTTTTINLGKALAMQGKNILLIDIDTQANLTYSLGIVNVENTIGNVLFNQCSIEQVVLTREGMNIIPANRMLYQYEEAIIKHGYGYDLLKQSLRFQDYDFVLIDCPPSQSQLNINALNASDHVIIPTLLDVLSLQGIHQITNTVNEVRAHLNPSLEVLGVLGVIVDERLQLSKDVLNHIKDNFSLKVFDTYIRSNVKAAEAPSHGISILEYAPQSKCAIDYGQLAAEILQLLSGKNAKSRKVKKAN